jgi:hypothetical protein
MKELENGCRRQAVRLQRLMSREQAGDACLQSRSRVSQLFIVLLETTFMQTGGPSAFTAPAGRTHIPLQPTEFRGLPQAN